ncbi:MAG TPA: hypothetical protein VIV60_12415 [Polyangiaceae bacterium]
MRNEVEAVLNQLLARDELTLSLDTIGEVIGAMYITQPEIEFVLQRLEEAGKSVGIANAKLRENLRPVIEQARRLKQLSGTNPSLSAIAEATQLSIGEVRAALLYASILGR